MKKSFEAGVSSDRDSPKVRIGVRYWTCHIGRCVRGTSVPLGPACGVKLGVSCRRQKIRSFSQLINRMYELVGNIHSTPPRWTLKSQMWGRSALPNQGNLKALEACPADSSPYECIRLRGHPFQ